MKLAAAAKHVALWFLLLFCGLKMLTKIKIEIHQEIHFEGLQPEGKECRGTRFDREFLALTSGNLDLYNQVYK